MRLKQIKTFFNFKRNLALLSLGLLIFVSLGRATTAQTVTQGYNYNGAVQRGMLVALRDDDPGQIELADLDNVTRLHGLVVDPNDAPATIAETGDNVFVATVGRYEALVSDQNGPIANGDYVTISNIEGIGMKAANKNTIAIGKALSAFNEQSTALSTAELKTIEGETQTVRIGRILLDIGIGANPLAEPPSNLPGFLRRAAESVANKAVSPIKIYSSLIILLAAIAIAASLLYSGVRSSLSAIGRNPLSRKSILRGLFQVILTSLIVLIIGLFGVYLLLKL